MRNIALYSVRKDKMDIGGSENANYSYEIYWKFSWKQL